MPEYTCRKGKIKKQSVTHDHAYIDEDAHKNIDKLDFPGFARHFLASKNSLFHIVLGIYRLCDYDALSDCRTSR